jgi:glycosyltransferase involved in cell wall biosynthesis
MQTLEANPTMKSAKSLLLVLPIVPWPIRRNGISLRFAPIVEYLARRYELDLLVLAESDEPLEREGPLKLCRSVTQLRVPVLTLPPLARKLKLAWSGLMPWGPPLGSMRHFALRELEAEVERHLQQNPYAVVVWAAGHYETAYRLRLRHPNVRFVIDFVDSPALAMARAKTTRPELRLFAGYNGWKWRRYERKVGDAFSAAIYISQVDAHSVRPALTSKVFVIPNGIALVDAPARVEKKPVGDPIVGFLGDMGYQPNISAVLRLAQRIFPRIIGTMPEARLLIIGRKPAAEIWNLKSPTITVTGTVEDIWSHIAQTSVFVFPMIEGVGMQNKILEAMYAEVPVVTTPIAAGGVGGRSGEHLLVGETDEEIAERAVSLLRDRVRADALATQARQFVTSAFDWNRILPRYEEILLPGTTVNTVSQAGAVSERH